MKVRSSFIAAALITSACGIANNTSVSRMGAMYPPNAANCQIKWENMNFQQASAAYNVIGMVTLTGPGATELSDKNKESIRAAACKTGGEAVSLNASNDTGSAMVGGTIQYLILRKPEGGAAPSNPSM